MEKSRTKIGSNAGGTGPRGSVPGAIAQGRFAENYKEE